MSNHTFSEIVATKTLKTFTRMTTKDGYSTYRTVAVRDASLMTEGDNVTVILSLEGIEDELVFSDKDAELSSPACDRTVWLSIPSHFEDEVMVTW